MTAKQTCESVCMEISVSSQNCFRVVSRRFASDLSPRVRSIDTHDTHDQITDEQRPRSASCQRTSRSDDETGSDSTSDSNHTNLPVIVHVSLIVSGMNPLCIPARKKDLPRLELSLGLLFPDLDVLADRLGVPISIP
jgi:hypothetical protein